MNCKRPINNSIYLAQKSKAVASFNTLERTMDISGVSRLSSSVSVLDGLPYYL